MMRILQSVFCMQREGLVVEEISAITKILTLAHKEQADQSVCEETNMRSKDANRIK